LFSLAFAHKASTTIQQRQIQCKSDGICILPLSNAVTIFYDLFFPLEGERQQKNTTPLITIECSVSIFKPASVGSRG
jgi:hypothetical protein